MAKRLISTWPVVVAFAFGVTSLAISQAAASLIYRLNQQTTYQKGCIPPCTCPVSEPVQVIGTFVLTPAPETLMATYQISEVNWTFIIGNQQILVTGSGSTKLGAVNKGFSSR